MGHGKSTLSIRVLGGTIVGARVRSKITLIVGDIDGDSDGNDVTLAAAGPWLLGWSVLESTDVGAGLELGIAVGAPEDCKKRRGKRSSAIVGIMRQSARPPPKTLKKIFKKTQHRAPQNRSQACMQHGDSGRQ